MRRRSNVWVWIAAAVAGSAVVALQKIAFAPDLDHGLPSAVGAVARFAFLPFWLSYTGGAWVALGFRRFAPVRDHARELGLAFAAAMAVHVGLICWQSLLGHPPALGVVVVFGLGAFLTLLLVAVSIPILANPFSRLALARFRLAATTYIALIYLRDFAIEPQPASLHYWAAYAVFAGLDGLGLAVRALAGLAAFRERWRSRAPARRALREAVAASSARGNEGPPAVSREPSPLSR